MKALLTLRAFLIFAIAVLCIGALYAFTAPNAFTVARHEVLLRKVGHELLLHSGDSTSRVLPVQKLGNGEYQLSFGKSFSFSPDTLAAIVKRVLASDGFSADFIVSVTDCHTGETVYGFAMGPKEDVVPCLGRIQPESCYRVNFKFEQQGITPLQKGLAAAPILAVAGMLMFMPVYRKRKERRSRSNDSVTVGGTIIDMENRCLVANGVRVALTVKESRLLLIFASAPNTVINRASLQKELWEDEGVIVGRSLDMFISRLRKKLENDPSLAIVNIHGKGYKLEVAG